MQFLPTFKSRASKLLAAVGAVAGGVAGVALAGTAGPVAAVALAGGLGYAGMRAGAYLGDKIAGSSDDAPAAPDATPNGQAAAANGGAAPAQSQDMASTALNALNSAPAKMLIGKLATSSATTGSNVTPNAPSGVPVLKPNHGL